MESMRDSFARAPDEDFDICRARDVSLTMMDGVGGFSQSGMDNPRSAFTTVFDAR